MMCFVASTLTPDNLWFTPFLVFSFSRLKKKEVVFVFTLQFCDFFVFYMLRRDFMLTFTNAIFVIFQQRGDMTHYEWIIPVMFVLCLLVCYGINVGVVKALKLRRRVGTH